MCTVTFIPGKDQVYLTSNRDEKHFRQDAQPPTVYRFESGQVLFPRDADAGGTWIAAHENGNAIVLLNGGFIPHEPRPPYRRSRGLIVLDLIEAATPCHSFKAIKLAGIEPFTAVIWDGGQLFECRWDGTEKHFRQLEEYHPHIWSSVTLYDQEVIRKRNNWFEQWLGETPDPDLDAILHFHQFTGEGDSHNDLRMNRNGIVYTVSVTALELKPGHAAMHYIDLRNNNKAAASLVIDKPATEA